MKRSSGCDITAPTDACEEHTEQLTRLESENRLRTEFAANVLHDIRSALAAVRGYLETPLVKNDLPPRVHRKYLEIAHKHTVRAGALVNELFALSVFGDIDVPCQQERFSLSELVMDTAMGFKLQAEQKKIRFTFDVGAAPAFTMGDIAQIQRVLENLISNGVRYTPEYGKLAISIVPGGDSIPVAISNSGPGIPEDRLPRIFDRFYTAHPHNEANSESAGLGLAIVKQILDLHGSPISVYSDVGSGTRFEFKLPLITEVD